MDTRETCKKDKFVHGTSGSYGTDSISLEIASVSLKPDTHGNLSWYSIVLLGRYIRYRGGNYILVYHFPKTKRSKFNEHRSLWLPSHSSFLVLAFSPRCRACGFLLIFRRLVLSIRR